MQDHEIVHVPGIVFYPADFLQVVIQGIKADVGHELAGKGADGYAGAVLSGGLMGLDYRINKAENPLIPDRPPDYLPENIVVYAREKLGDIAFEN
jgi:hypothetical protein